MSFLTGQYHLSRPDGQKTGVPIDEHAKCRVVLFDWNQNVWEDVKLIKCYSSLVDTMGSTRYR